VLGNVIQPELKELMTARRWEELRAVVHEFHPADLAEIIIDLPSEDEAILFRVLPRAVASEVFTHLPAEHQESLIESLTGEHVRSILEQMSPDDRTHLFEEVPPEVTRRLLAALNPADLSAARALLGYASETAGRYMTPQYLALRPDMTCAEALEQVRRSGKQVETLTVLYLVDGSGRLIEDLRLGSLVLAIPEARVSEIHDRPLIAVDAAL